MKLTESPIKDLEGKAITKIKKKKSLKKPESVGGSKDFSELVAQALKKPRTRAVSLTLSENGIDEMLNGAPKASSPEKKKKSDKPKKKKSAPKVAESAPEVAAPVEIDDGVPPEHAGGRFSNFPISEKTIGKLKAKGINYLFPIQVQTFQKVLEGKDVIAKARTGTGKTLAFALPLIEKIQAEQGYVKRGRPPKVIVLAPTRELVNQVAKDFKSLSSLSIHAFYGGVGMGDQGTALRTGIDVLVGTPGRLLDWISRGQLDTSSLEHVVLDEVDQMLDMGFADDVENIISHSYNRGEGRANPQTLLFSATLPPWVKKTATKYMESMPPVIDLVGNSLNQTANNVTHVAIRSHYKDRAADVSKIIQYYSGESGRSMVFCHTKRDVDELALCPDIKQNKEKLHGDVKQATRETVLEKFRQGSIKVLVTTNVAARGLDVPEVDLVIQTEPPADIESYIHRSGRTGRAGKSGVSVCFYTNRTEHDLIRVERFAKLSFKRLDVPTADDLAKRGLKELSGTLDAVDEKMLAKFKDTAEELISERGAVNAVSALIALATGQTKHSNTSLINSREGFVTLQYSTNAVMRFKGYVYNVLKNKCPSVDNMIKNLMLTTDGKGAVFDIPDDIFAKNESQLLFKTSNDSLVVATSLPELQQPINAFNNTGSNNSFNGGARRSWGHSGGRAAKRPFQQQNFNGDAASNKRIKFD